ncbi:MAG: ABC transporter ATP-binding protein [Bifidobacteriaceae bacterium]|jgi:oligopeptide transport system ATP-binding protein|nr:ABC transporter ATP-binding protein [Bifidobacteriaceae bacterium]
MSTEPQNRETLLEIEDLSVHFHTETGLVKAVKHMSLSMAHRSILGLVGESGSGKSVTALSILQLLGTSRASIPNGRILFEGENLLTKTPRQMQQIRGSHIGLVSQNALSALDPSFTIGAQLIEVIRYHQNLDRTTARSRALELLELVALPDPLRRLKSYPHELSGGQRQRVVIAIALSAHPELLLADEPTTALDATVQKQILDLLLDIHRELGTAILLVTHDFGVVAHICTDVAVMRRGVLVEKGTTSQVLTRPEQPYTKGLMRAVPRLHPDPELAAKPRSERRLFEFTDLKDDPPELAPAGALSSPSREESGNG